MNLLPGDVRAAARAIGRRPGFAVLVVVTLALGVGANTAIFSMVNAVLLHPYDLPDLDRLVRVWESTGGDPGFDTRFIAPGDGSDFAHTASIAAMTTYRCGDLNLSARGGVQPVLGCRVSSGFFDVLQAKPSIGRGFTPADEQPGGDTAAVVSDGFAKHHLGGTSALGRVVHIDGRAYTVVGIMPRGFDYPVPMEVWIPLALAPAERADRGRVSLEALARLAPGATLGQARAELDMVARRLSDRFPRTNAGRTAAALPLRQELYRFTLPLFLLLQLGAGLVLLLTAANLAVLLVARNIGRQRELAVRAALGAGRWRLIRLLCTETTLLAAVAAVVAAAASFWTVGALRTSISPDWTMWVPGWDAMDVNRTVLAFTAVAALAAGAAVGLTTALHALRRGDSTSALKTGDRGSMDRSSRRLASGLVVAQVALALPLLSGAGLVARGFAGLSSAYEGFEPRQVIKAEVRLPERDYGDEARVRGYYDELLRLARGLPGVTGAAVASNTPASNVDSEPVPFNVQDRPVPAGAQPPTAAVVAASPDYFSTLRIRLVDGRAFTEADRADSPRVVLVSRGMAARYWKHGDAVGRHLRLAGAEAAAEWATVVGIVQDVRQNWWNQVAQPVIYVPFAQSRRRSMSLLVRAADAGAEMPALRAGASRLDSAVALTGLSTLDTEVTDSIAIVKVMGALMAIFGAVALLLSAVGVFGLLSEQVARQTREIGIRVALGAEPGHLTRQVVFRAAALVGGGVVIGVPLAYALGRLLAGAFYGVFAEDTRMFFACALLLSVVGGFAAYLPARRATRIDPLAALRCE